MLDRLLASPRLGRVLGRWIRIGRRSTMSPADARYVVLTNIVALLGVLFTLGFAPVLAVSGHAIYPILQVCYALGYLPVLWLNHRGHRVAATTWLILGAHLLVFSQLLVEGAGFDVQLFFMLHAALPYMVFPPRHNRLMFALSALAGLDLMLVVTFGDRLPQLGPLITADRLAIIRPILLGGLFATLAACAYYARRATLIAEDALDLAHRRSEELLLNILPPAIATRLKFDGSTIADGFPVVSVLFADIVGFTKISARLPPGQIVALLNELFCRFDDLADRHGLEKIKTIGDCYMLASGLPMPRPDHAAALADMALEMIRIAGEVSAKSSEQIVLRIGIHSGPVVAGVIGKRKFIYDLWGDTVNTASRMESHGVPGEIQVTSATHALLADQFAFTARGKVEIHNMGAMDTWLLVGRASATSARAADSASTAEHDRDAAVANS